ncbi:MAG: alpha-E domain-containing protein [Pseudonocardia sp.]
MLSAAPRPLARGTRRGWPRRPLDAARVVQFLLIDKLFPRSVFHALRQAETCLIELDNRPTVRIGARAEALRLLGRARSELEFLRPDELLDDLPTQLTACRRRSATSARPCRSSTSHAAPWVAWTAPG